MMPDVPIGTVMPFYSNANVPNGWMRLTKGRRNKGIRLEKAKYPKLWRAVGPVYGRSTQRFGLPYIPGNGWVDYIIRIR